MSDKEPTLETWDSLWNRSDRSLAERRLELERQSTRWCKFRDYLYEKYGNRQLQSVELGSGEGDFSILMSELGHKVTLVDFSPTALERAKARYDYLGIQAEYVQADLFEFAKEYSGKFDVSASLGLAEHFAGERRNQIIEAHRQVLNEDGITFISVPHAWCVPYRLRKAYLQLRGWWRYGYTDPFSSPEIRRVAKRVGFESCRTYNTGFAASVDACLLQPFTGKRIGWKDGPRWANQIGGWDVNLIAKAA